VLPMPSEDAVRARRTSMDQAMVVLSTHVPTQDGMCAGCLRHFGRWVEAAACSQRPRARSVIETHGVAEEAWDRRASVRSGAALAA
jgi:hypothetical protein